MAMQVRLLEAQDIRGERCPAHSLLRDLHPCCMVKAILARDTWGILHRLHTEIAWKAQTCRELPDGPLSALSWRAGDLFADVLVVGVGIPRVRWGLEIHLEEGLDVL